MMNHSWKYFVFTNTNCIPSSSSPARWDCHQTRKTPKRRWEGGAGDPQQEEGAGAPLWHDRGAILDGSPRHPGGRRMLTEKYSELLAATVEVDPVMTENSWTITLLCCKEHTSIPAAHWRRTQVLDGWDCTVTFWLLCITFLLDKWFQDDFILWAAASWDTRTMLIF